LAARAVHDNVIHGDHAMRKSGAGQKFWQFREYQQGDEPNSIDWRQSAKGDAIFIKQKEWQTSLKTYLWCASGKSMMFTSGRKHYSKQNCAQIITLALALMLKDAKEHVGIYGDSMTGRSEFKMEHIAQSLIDQRLTDIYLPNINDISLPKNAYFIGLGDFLSPIEEIEANIKALSMRTGSGIIIQVLDPAELNLTYTGRIRFKGLKNKENETVNSISSIAQDYSARISEHNAALRNLCTENGWHYILHQTDHDITKTLNDIAAISREGK